MALIVQVMQYAAACIVAYLCFVIIATGIARLAKFIKGEFRK